MPILEHKEYMITCEQCDDILSDYVVHTTSKKESIKRIEREYNIKKYKGKHYCNKCKPEIYE